MQRIFSLLALGITLAVTAAQNEITLTSIRAVSAHRANKDLWSMKGFFNDPDGTVVDGISDFGVIAGIADKDQNTLNMVPYRPIECRLLKNDKGLVCKTTGTRLLIKKTKRVPKGATIQAQRSHNTTTSSYYMLSGVFRRQEFINATILTPLSAGISIDFSPFVSTNTKCTEKVGKRTSKYICTPGAPTPAPTPGSTT